MRKDLLDDIIDLKETKRILEAACDEKNINKNTFSKSEQIVLEQLKNDMHNRDMLRDVKDQITSEEVELKNEISNRYM